MAGGWLGGAELEASIASSGLFGPSVHREHLIPVARRDQS